MPDHDENQTNPLEGDGTAPVSSRTRSRAPLGKAPFQPGTPEPKAPGPRSGGGFFATYCGPSTGAATSAGTNTPGGQHVTLTGRDTPFRPTIDGTAITSTKDDTETHTPVLSGLQCALFRSDEPQVVSLTRVPGKPELNTLIIDTVFTKATIEFMARHYERNHSRRLPDQRQLFGESANDKAQTAHYDYTDQQHFCHIAGYALGGRYAHELLEVNEQKARKHMLKKSPQRRDNIFVGSMSMNGMMMVVETLIRNKLLDGTVDEVELHAELQYDTPLASTGDDTMFGHALSYGIRCLRDKKCVFEETFQFEPLSDKKPLADMPKTLSDHFDAEVAKQLAESENHPSSTSP